MQDKIQNRFTSNKFETTRAKRIAKGKYFTATLTCTGRTYRADIQWEPGYEANNSAVTAFSEDSLADALRKYDPAVRFLDVRPDVNSLPAGDAAMLENARNDSKTSNALYASMCARFKQKPKVRPIFYDLDSQMGEDFATFRAAHPDLAYGGFEEFNQEMILQFVHDEKALLVLDSFEKAYAELSAAGMFRSFDTGRVNGRIVQPYNHAALVAARRQASVEVASRPPANLSPVDLQCWELVRASFPSLDVRSPEFRKRCSSQIQAWARENALNEGFTDGTGEMRQRIDQIVLDWGRQAKPSLGDKKARDSRTWLG
jgi:hypothetical protein